ncbi:MAG: bifunctional 5,10-methylenetetrahydrofolate dehydrogenase/5,10-methenyltetrahydrofolate cyclohydrolase [bacterium]|nr:bifunctional 5,10-methylenetetrahydrofolate dehydrogenase/5,10-methenyltetrahydrofolate cyclohydrolase [bacterium]MDZ4296025.1 bifunctional 5,10-methylenetetrahydrofolate dehydrogenase/5,10-methenyltetrahydrofolate cyclohydrolase [Patescibacteria group bacterium]
MILLDGKPIAQTILAELRGRFAALDLPRPPRLCAILVGQDPASIAFLKQKEKTAGEAGVEFRIEEFPETISTERLRSAIVAIGRQKVVGAMIAQLPLPGHLNVQAILNAIPPEKDADVLTERSTGKFVLGRLPFDPPPVAGLRRMLGHYKLRIAGKYVVLVGQGRLIGKSLSWWLTNQGNTFTATNAETPDLGRFTRAAECIITGVGKPKLITADMIAQDAIVIDFGFARVDDATVGDVDFEAVAAKAAAVTPVPGGMGPLTVALLFENLYTLLTHYGSRA